MKNSFHSIVSVLLAALMLLSLAGCREQADKKPAAPASADSAASSDEALSTADEAPTTAPTAAPTAAPTSPSREKILSGDRSDPSDVSDAAGFVSLSDVIPDAVLDIRYSTSHNFVGDPISGYDEPLALMTKEAAAALTDAANELREKGYRLKIYDAYRPQRAVDRFVSWANDLSDTRMKSEFYPEVDKSLLFSSGYIASRSGHSRGSTIDLSLVNAADGTDVDMGGSFDYFGALSHPDYTGITPEQYSNRMTLRSAMLNNGFSPLDTEWWHFTLNSEPYPYTYFNFPVSTASLPQ